MGLALQVKFPNYEFKEAEHFIFELENKAAGARALRCCLERFLKELCSEKNISVNGKINSTLNDELRDRVVYSEKEYLQVKSWLRLRNKASHISESVDYKLEEVKKFYQDLRSFIRKYS